MKLFRTTSLTAASIALLFFTSSAALALEGEHDHGPFSSPEPAVADIAAVLTGYASEVAKSNIEGMAAYVIQSSKYSIIEGGHANWGWADYRDNHLRPNLSPKNSKAQPMATVTFAFGSLAMSLMPHIIQGLSMFTMAKKSPKTAWGPRFSCRRKMAGAFAICSHE